MVEQVRESSMHEVVRSSHVLQATLLQLDGLSVNGASAAGFAASSCQPGNEDFQVCPASTWPLPSDPCNLQHSQKNPLCQKKLQMPMSRPRIAAVLPSLMKEHLQIAERCIF